MKLAILFWIYKEPEICAERARLLRRFNPDTPIYVLYGGEVEDAPIFAEALKTWTDDFYTFPEPWPALKKWLQGDQLLSAWHRERGVQLDWDTFFIAQWDLLLLSPLAELCGSLGTDQVLLPGLRPIREVRDWWWWTRPNSEEGEEYQRFVDALGERFPEDPYCCNFLAGALPRRFMDDYARIENPDLGFLEYKMPVYAQVFGFDFCRDHQFNPIWQAENRSRLLRVFDTFHAEKTPIPRPVAFLNAKLPGGRRVFHPYPVAAPWALR